MVGLLVLWRRPRIRRCQFAMLLPLARDVVEHEFIQLGRIVLKTSAKPGVINPRHHRHHLGPRPPEHGSQRWRL
jgi:hypothetical protein